MCRTNPREFKPRSGGASAPRKTSSWSRASLMSLPQPPRKIRWNIAVLCSTNAACQGRARSGRREVRLGPAPAARLRPRRVGAECVGSYMAQVAEVAVSKDGDVAVKRITCAVDCGIGINPNTIEAQAQSAIVYGLTAALYGEITLKDGRVE